MLLEKELVKVANSMPRSQFWRITRKVSRDIEGPATDKDLCHTTQAVPAQVPSSLCYGRNPCAFWECGPDCVGNLVRSAAQVQCFLGENDSLKERHISGNAVGPCHVPRTADVDGELLFPGAGANPRF